ncbi:hypothetical protein DSECCO2_198710 [anaerobic digester metagenome]
MGKKIDALHLLHLIPRRHKKRQIPGQGRRLAGHVDKGFWLKIQNLKDRLGVDAIPGRVQNNYIGRVMEVGHLHHHVSGNKLAIIQPILFRIRFGGFYRFSDQLNADHFFCHRCQHLGNGASAAVQIIDDLVLFLSDKLPNHGVELFGPQGIGLEKRKAGDFKGQSQNLIFNFVFTIQRLGRFSLDHIGDAIILRMENPPDLTFQL